MIILAARGWCLFRIDQFCLGKSILLKIYIRKNRLASGLMKIEICISVHFLNTDFKIFLAYKISTPEP